MTERIRIIVDNIPISETFADIGCDHGYVAEAMLKTEKCKTAIISDVSEKCLKKAERLLERYISDGRAKAIVSDGFDKLPCVDTALIAGIGGEETIKILKKADNLPENLVLSPMKNVPAVRSYLNSIGYKTIKDFIFKAGGKFYDLICLKKGKKGGEVLDEEAILFGKTNIEKPETAFYEWAKREYEKMIVYSERANETDKEKILEKAKRLEKYVFDK